MAKFFHVYAIDGFASAHSSKEAAIKAAKRGEKARGLVHKVFKCSLSGRTGQGHGTEVFSTEPV